MLLPSPHHTQKKKSLHFWMNEKLLSIFEYILGKNVLKKIKLWESVRPPLPLRKIQFFLFLFYFNLFLAVREYFDPSSYSRTHHQVCRNFDLVTHILCTQHPVV
jgi:hypothetical protein